MLCLKTWKKRSYWKGTYPNCTISGEFKDWNEWIKFTNENYIWALTMSREDDWVGKIEHPSDLPSYHLYWAKCIKAEFDYIIDILSIDTKTYTQEKLDEHTTEVNNTIAAFKRDVGISYKYYTYYV